MSDDTEHGQTYSDACDELLLQGAQAMLELERGALEHRAVGDRERAEELERQREALENRMLALVETRREMPFGVLSDEQLAGFLEMFGPRQQDDDE